jgi:Tfp pilus assembly protein PilN
MLRYIEQKIVQIKKITGIEIILSRDDRLHINTTTVSIKKNKIIKEQANIGLESLDELIGKIDTEIPLAIVVNGKGVLIRKITVETNASLQSIIPGFNPNDFYFEKFSNKTLSILSIIRKENLDKIIGDLKSRGLKPISISLGTAVLNNIAPFLEFNGDSDLETDSFIIKMNGEKQIQDFKNKDEIKINKYQPEEFKVADQYVKPSSLLSFAAAVHCLTDDLTSEIQIKSALVESERSEYRYLKLFKTLGIGISIAFLLILLINFFLYTDYLNKNQALQTSQMEAMDQQKQIHKLENEIARKEKFLQRSAWTKPGKTSYYADRIASMIPRDIVLTSLNIYPVKSNPEIETGNNLFKKDTIQINGICQDPEDLNTFISNLKIISKFNDVVLKNYQYKSEKESGTFFIEATTKD